MQLTGPAPVLFGGSAATVQVAAVSVDPTANRLTVVYANPANVAQVRTATGPISPGGLTAIASEVGTVVASAEGWLSPPVANTQSNAIAQGVLKGP